MKKFSTLIFYVFLFEKILLAQNPVLLADANSTIVSPTGYDNTFGISNSLLYFIATDNTGLGIWRTDGTPGGTFLLKNSVSFGAVAFQTPTDVNGNCYFVASASENCTYGKYDYNCDEELWKSDGTIAGTTLVKDIIPGTVGSEPFNLINVNGTLFFAAITGNTSHLYKSDGTDLGTLDLGAVNMYNGQETALNSLLIFSGGSSNAEPWVSDGTVSGTHVIKEINSTGPSSPQFLTTFNGAVYFSATDGGTAGTALWKTDGTSTGTTIVKDFSSGTTSTFTDIEAINGKLLIVVADDTHGAELWSSDGTTVGTSLVMDINPGSAGSAINRLTGLGNIAYFFANDGAHGNEPWLTDGTLSGTHMVSDLTPGAIGSSGCNCLGNFFSIGTKVIFKANTNSGTGLFVTDGTSNGTSKFYTPFSLYSTTEKVFQNTLYFIDNAVMITDGTTQGTNDFDFGIIETESSYPGLMRKMSSDQFFFSARDSYATGNQPWVTDGTSSGTHIIKHFDNTTGCTPMKSSTGKFFFSQQTTDGNNGIWVTDGTTEGTSQVASINTPANDSTAVLNNILYFGTTTGEFWRSDGTQPGTYRVKDINPAGNDQVLYEGKIVVYNGIMYFDANDGVHGIELWRSDGTDAGTYMVKDIASGTASSYPVDFKVFNGKLIFAGSDGVNGNEPWVSDGTDAGTFMLKNIYAGSLGSGPAWFTVSGNNLFFTAAESGHPYELWKTDGTTNSTVIIKEFFFAGTSNYVIVNLKDVNGMLYLAGSDAADGLELWKSDGTTNGTMLVKDIYSGKSSSSPTYLTNVNGELYFTSTDGTNPNQIWKSDGTFDGTIKVADLPFGGPAYDLRNIEGILYFRFNGEYWRTDGTACHTQNLDFIPGKEDGVVTLLTDSNKIFFSMFTEQYGSEPWKYEASPIPSVEVCNGFDDDCNGFIDDNALVATITPSGTISECKATDVTLACDNVGSDLSYQWRKDGAEIIGATDQSYTQSNDKGDFDVQVTSSFGCIDISDPTTVDRIKKPKATITPLGSLDICSTGSVGLQANSGTNYTYSWKKNGKKISGATNQVYTATTIGDYKVKVTNADGCSKTSQAMTVYSSCKEISSTDKETFSLYPNPTTGNLTIQFNESFSAPIEISITDILGRKVFEEETVINGNSISLQLDAKISNGTYLLTIQSSQTSIQKLFEVQR